MEKEDGGSTLTIVSPASSTTCTQLSCFFFLFSTRSGVTKALTLVLLLTLSNLADLTCPSVSFGFPIFKMKELE